MDIGSVFIALMGGPPGPSHPFKQWVSDAERFMKAQERAGFSFAAFTHAYQGGSSGGMPPPLIMSRLAPISGKQRLATQVLLLPLMNAMDAAYSISTVDHITEGRLDVGIGLGYHPKELEPAGISRSDRVPKFEESVELMRKFWSGEPVYHKGRYYSVSGTQLDLLPVQKPHPPLWGSAHSTGAAARAGRTLDGIVVGPQVGFNGLGNLLDTFRGEWYKVHSEEPTMVGAWRSIIVGNDLKDDFKKGSANERLRLSRYHEGGMQERTTVDIVLDLREEDAADWAILGNYDDCLEGLKRCRDELKLTHVTCQFYNLPEDLSARLEWLEGFGEQVCQRL